MSVLLRQWFLISVVGYGDFAYWGTEEEAEERRHNKAIWEGERATKHVISPSHPEVKVAIEEIQADIANNIAVEDRELEAIQHYVQSRPETQKSLL